MKPNMYTIVQSVPDPIAGERINVGVIVVDSGDHMHYRFLSNWKRVKSFAGADVVETSKYFIEELEIVCLGMGSSRQMRLDDRSISPRDVLSDMVQGWSNQIQFTPLAPSLEDARSLLERLSQRYLKEKVTRLSAARRRPQIIHEAQRQLRYTLADISNADQEDLAVAYRPVVKGQKVKSLEVDFGVLEHEDSLALAGQAVSFQIADVREIRSQWLESIYRLADVQDAAPEVPVALIVAPPLLGLGRSNSAWTEQFNLAKQAADDNGIDFVDERDLDAWSEDAARIVIGSAA